MTSIIQSQRLKRLGSCCLFTAVLLFLALIGFSQSQRVPTGTSSVSAIAVKTELVVLPVSVTDTNGEVVSGLSQQNFSVYDDRRLQKITLFEQGDTPVTVGLVVDHSRSMGSKLPEVADAVIAFAQSSNPQDEMFVVDFNDDVSVELMDGKPFTNNPKMLARAVSSVHARGQTALYDAIAEGLIHLQLAHWDKKALIIVSDGGDNASQQKFAQVLALAQQSQVLIYSIGLIGQTEDVNPGVLRRLSKATGGIAYFPEGAAAVTNISAQISRDLRGQYTLGFAPEKANGVHTFRKLEVKVDAPGHGKIRVRTRTGYIFTEEKSPAAHALEGAK